MKKISEFLSRAREFEKKVNTSGDKIEKSFENFEKKLERGTGELEKKLEHNAEALGKKLDRSMQTLDKKFENLDRFLDEKTAAWERIFRNEKLPDIILEAHSLKKYFTGRGKQKHQTLRAVDGADFIIPRGETLGVVGESGCGKSTAARVMIGLLPATEGTVLLDGEPIHTPNYQKQREIRRRTGIVFQDPYGSMDPRMAIADIVGEPLRAHKLANSKSDLLLQSLEILELCGMRADDLFKFPHQFSGGQRQRICIARALITKPDVVVCDEAVSALDVSIQAQIINLLCDLRQQRGLTYLFISHDLEVVRFIADRVAVMYQGRIVETAKKEDLFRNPIHPYTKILLESAPVFGKKRIFDDDSDVDAETLTASDVSGCRFHSRCPVAREECKSNEPELSIKTEGHAAACHYA